jgi:AraC-like DNA-binding protein
MAFVSRVAYQTLRPLFAQAERARVVRAELLAAAGIRDEPPPDAMIAYDQVTRLWQHAARLAGDEAFGVHAAEHAPHGAFDVLEYAALTSVTLGDALSRLCRYQRLLTEVATYKLAGSALRLELRLGANRLAASHHAIEYLLACVVAKATRATGGARPVVARFRHRGKPSAEHRRVFGCTIERGAAHDELVFDPATLAAPLELADPVLRAILDRHASGLLDRLPETDLFGARVDGWVRERLADEPTLASAARHFRLSQRGLQRRLAEERDTFEALLDRTRRHEAMHKLADRTLTVADVAAALGFSEASAFHRAFKRWTNMTPAAWRRQLA